MNEYEKRLRQLAAEGALSDAQVAEVVTCAKAAGVRVEMEHIDLSTGHKRRWVVEPDAQPEQPKVRVYGRFERGIPDEMEARPQ